MDDWLRARYPGLASSRFAVTSPATDRYNCVAWAAGHDSEWWSPDGYWWPRDGVREWSLDTMMSVFRMMGYETGASAELEPGIEKIAIYGFDDDPKHVARQVETGRWTSKLGKNVDIEHDLDGLRGSRYGEVLALMSRPRPVDPLAPLPLVWIGFENAEGA